MLCWRRSPSAAPGTPATRAASRFDQILDLYVRDGFVYYRALESGPGHGSTATSARWRPRRSTSAPRDEQIAFWLNAYNALVLQTVIDHYPIPQRTPDYPAHSIRQIPGAFERLPHRVAGRTLTLDQIEQTILPEFHDPRVFLALGRGAVGSGRLRSEAYRPAATRAQLSEAATSAPAAPVHRRSTAPTTRCSISSIFSWRAAGVLAAYAGKAPAVFATRSPIERAVLAFVEPQLLTTEREFLAKNAVQGRLHAVRLVAQRPHRPRRTMRGGRCRM